MKTKQELKLYFENGDKPTQEQFWQWMDSYWHKEEIVERVIPLIVDDILLGNFLSVTLPNAKTIGSGVFNGGGSGHQIIEVIFSEGTEFIGFYTFYNQNIKHIKTPDTLKSIGNGAFEDQGNNNGSDSLEKITLNEGLISISNNAFKCPKATAIKDLYIPNSVQSVGAEAFAIPSLQTVSAPAGLNLSNSGIPSTATITYR